MPTGLVNGNYFDTNVGVGFPPAADAMLDIRNTKVNALSIDFTATNNALRLTRTGAGDLAYAYKPAGQPLIFLSLDGGGTTVPGFQFSGSWGVAIDGPLSVGGAATVNGNATFSGATTTVAGTLWANNGIQTGANGIAASGPIVVSGVNGTISASQNVSGLGFVAGTNGVSTNGPIFAFGTSALLLGTSGSERLRIDASGNVGIGISTPGERLHVNGNIRVTDTAIVDNDVWAKSAVKAGVSSTYPQGRRIADINGCYYA